MHLKAGTARYHEGLPEIGELVGACLLFPGKSGGGDLDLRVIDVNTICEMHTKDAERIGVPLYIAFCLVVGAQYLVVFPTPDQDYDVVVYYLPAMEFF